jgi:anti-anti-sigma factor
MASDLFRIHQDRVPPEQAVQIVELSLPQQLASDEFDRLNQLLLRAFADQPDGRWVLDLSRSSYMGSPALGLMVNIWQQVKAGGGRLALCGLSSQLLRIFQTCCLERLFVIKSDRDAALRAVRR